MLVPQKTYKITCKTCGVVTVRSFVELLLSSGSVIRYSICPSCKVDGNILQGPVVWSIQKDIEEFFTKEDSQEKDAQTNH